MSINFKNLYIKYLEIKINDDTYGERGCRSPGSNEEAS